MSYADERRRAMISRNNQNKSRSRQMEARVAKLLSGNRIPMSGAGSIKGDVRVITKRWGEIMVECKYSAGMSNKGDPRIRIDFRWFDKLDRDVKAMRGTAFGILVFHYHNQRYTDYVMMRRSMFEQFMAPREPVLDGAVIIDLTGKSGINLLKPMVESALYSNSNGYPFAIIRYSGGDLVLFSLETLKEMFDEPETILGE